MDQQNQAPPASQNVVPQPSPGQSFTPPQSKRFIPWYIWVIIAILLIIASVSIFYIFFRMRTGEQAPVSQSQIPIGTPAANQGGTNEATNGASLIDTSNWKTYSNNTYGFLLKYPPDWYIVDSIPQDAGLRINLRASGNWRSYQEIPSMAIIITSQSESVVQNNIKADYTASSSGQMSYGILNGIESSGLTENDSGNFKFTTLTNDFVVDQGKNRYWFRLFTPASNPTSRLAVYHQILSTFKFL